MIIKVLISSIEIDDINVEALKNNTLFFAGDDGFGRRLLSEIKTPLQLFDSLQKHLFLSRNNLLFLQAMLHRIGRMDLYDMALDYAQTLGDVIYFCSPPPEPGKIITLHINCCKLPVESFHFVDTVFCEFVKSSIILRMVWGSIL